ncbi:hypothetical protein G9A89_012547 [Geosiphon pyriformis]|nr:hypothetical protein G9A89_012547 [Geosiphon pyriformis]
MREFKRRGYDNSAENVLSQKPLIVGVSGPQGCGKTTLCNYVAQTLSTQFHLNVITFSMDDFYLTYNAQRSLSLENPDNKLLEYRGLPGTHDIRLGAKVFEDLFRLHSDQNHSAQIPHYNKSLKNGRGDRSPKFQWTKIQKPVDIIIFEGWSLGFRSLPIVVLETIYKNAQQNSSSHLPSHKFEHLVAINRYLAKYETDWYPFLDTFIHMDPLDINYVYEWRLQQEHTMRAKGLEGMTDEQVKDFVDRYMPAYELYLPGLRDGCFFVRSGDYCQESLNMAPAVGSVVVQVEVEKEQLIQGFKKVEGKYLKIVLNQEREVVAEIELNPLSPQKLLSL